LGRETFNQVDEMMLNSDMTMLLYKVSPVLRRRLCITTQGYFGIVPPFAEEGDHI
jgi:hypothetical protein